MSGEPTDGQEPDLPKLEPLFPDGAAKSGSGEVAPTEPAAIARTVVCRQCGYDLRGIPEDRCPECGYGFDRRAIRDLALQDNLARDSIYCRTIVLSIVSVTFVGIALLGLALFLAPAILGVPVALVLYFVVAGLVVGTWGLHRHWGEPLFPSQGVGVWRLGSGLLVAAAISTSVLFSILTAQIIASVAVAIAWLNWVSLDRCSPHTMGAASARYSAELHRRRCQAVICLMTATLVVVGSWLFMR